MRIPKEEYQARRAQLLANLPDNSFALFAAAPITYRNSDTQYPFRQNSDFEYLTGFPDHDAIALFLPKCREGEFILFTLPKDTTAEIWTGRRPGTAGALQHYGANKAFPLEVFETVAPKLLAGYKKMFLPKKHNQLKPLFDKCDALNAFEKEIVDPIIHEMRLRKSENEIDLMRRAASISAQAHMRAMQACRPDMYEYQLQAEIEYMCMQAGACNQAYTPIVAGGENACTLHYVSNQDKLKNNELVLIDAGGEYQHYASDITRTFPINGKFTAAQRALYNAVLKAQLDVIEMIKPGVTRGALEEKAQHTLTTELVALGILEGDIEALIEEKAFSSFYMHRIGHWLGLDVHDVGAYKIEEKWRALEPGFVLTVEPGIYIATDNKDVEEKWRGIGIRIEDDVLVTTNGYDVLSKDAPKTCEAIEATMAS